MQHGRTAPEEREIRLGLGRLKWFFSEFLWANKSKTRIL